jgi:hypothetical protein
MRVLDPPSSTRGLQMIEPDSFKRRPTFPVDVHLQRVTGGDKRVDAQVELEAVDEQRAVQVIAGDQVGGVRVRLQREAQLCAALDQPDALALQGPGLSNGGKCGCIRRREEKSGTSVSCSAFLAGPIACCCTGGGHRL